MPKPVAWSYSALNQFETCPRQYHEERVAKRVKQTESKEMRWGKQVHRAMELFLKDEAPLPEHLKEFEDFVGRMKQSKGKLLVEERTALNAKLQPVTYFAKDVWVRGVIDAGVLLTERAILLDWKTVKRKVDVDQLKLFAAIGFATYPWVDSIETGFVWMKSKEFDKQTFYRDDVAEIWDDFLPRVKRLEHAFQEEKWPPKPSGLCRGWCPVPKSLCEFSGGD